MPNPFHAIDARFGLEPLPGGAQPIFLLAAGWRSGSTLLQRLAVSSGEALIWGEPYGRAAIIPGLTRATMVFRPDWPAAAAIASEHIAPGAELHERWIANFYPEPRSFRAAMRALLDELLMAPAKRRGFARFGLKEVRLSAIDAAWLEWLYPDARFVFLVRNPWDSWASMKGNTWYWRWPDQPVSTAGDFAQIWSALLTSFRQWQSASGMLVRYEDLQRDDFDLAPLCEHLQLARMDPAVRATRLRGIAQSPSPLDTREIATIAAAAGPLAQALGYAPPNH
jgi:hypothetical protein